MDTLTNPKNLENICSHQWMMSALDQKISECTISSGVRALYDFLTGKVSLCCFPKMQPSQTLSVLSINANPFTILFVWSSFSTPKFRCPNLKCHSQDSSRTSVWNAAWKSALSFSFLSKCLTVSLLSTLNAPHVFVFPFMYGTIINGNKRLLVIGTFLSASCLDACL